MAFSLNKPEDMKKIYEAAKDVFEHKISATKAVASLIGSFPGSSEASLKMYFSIYGYMRQGKCYKKGTNAGFTKFLLENIFSDFGEDAFAIAVSSVKLHVGYRASIQNAQPGIERVCRQVITELGSNIDYDKLSEYNSGTTEMNALSENFVIRWVLNFFHSILIFRV